MLPTINQSQRIMLQSEFYDRTGVTLTTEEYGEVENIYNRVQMNKDEFCKLWMKCRDNKIIKELVQTCMGYEKKCAALEKVEKEFERQIVIDAYLNEIERINKV